MYYILLRSSQKAKFLYVFSEAAFMDSALEMLDFLNIKFSDDKSFKKAVENPLISYEAHGRVINLKSHVLRRTRQLVEEALKAKFNQAPFWADDNGVQVYTVKVKPGELSVRIMGDQKTADCYLVRSVEWLPDWDASAQLVGFKSQILPLEQLVGSIPSWADKRLPQEHVVREIKHYFASLFYDDKRCAFSGLMTHGNRGASVRIYLKNYSALSLQVELQNK
jgi:hypothetical protein